MSRHHLLSQVDEIDTKSIDITVDFKDKKKQIILPKMTPVDRTINLQSLDYTCQSVQPVSFKPPYMQVSNKMSYTNTISSSMYSPNQTETVKSSSVVDSESMLSVEKKLLQNDQTANEYYERRRSTKKFERKMSIFMNKFQEEKKVDEKRRESEIALRI